MFKKMFVIFPTKVKSVLMNRGFLPFLSNENKIKTNYKVRTGLSLNLDEPKRYNEKLQWLKLYWRDPLAKQCADKYLVREYIKETIGNEFLNELIGVYESVDEINIDTLPEQFVLKGTHGSGFNIIVKNKNNHDWNKEFKKMKKWLEIDYSKYNNEWVYKNLKPRIICEKYLEDFQTNELRDYKFFTFNGVPKFMFVASDRANDTRFDYFDLDFNHLDFRQKYPQSVQEIKKPKNFDLMVNLSRDLGEKFPHVRVDFFECNNKIYFSELTFFHFSGLERFYPDKYDFIFGEYLDLSVIKKENI